MNTVRYWIAVIVIMSYPVGLLLWVAIHPFARFWRRLGTSWTYTILALPSLGWMAAIVLLRKKILVVQYGSHALLMVAAAVFMIIAVLMSLKRRRYLTFSLLAGNPELAETRYPGTLLTGGPYARIRHPRYIEAIFFTLGYVLLANYLAAYLMFLLSLPLLMLVVVLEEKELRERFGDRYDEYCSRVPRFFPRRKKP